MKVTMCDPPEGWRYGFPKPMPSYYMSPNFVLIDWLVENGYPKDKLGYNDYCKFWEEDV